MKRLAQVLPAAALLAACSGVELPPERYFGLTVDVEAAAPELGPAVPVLRLFDLQLAGAIDRDYPMTAAGVELGRNELDRWIAPLDRLVTDALIVGLSRRRVAALVKGAVDPGPEQWQLHGRILEFAAVPGETGSFARVALELWLLAGDELLLRDEFAASEPIDAPGTAAAVHAAARALATVVGQVEARLRRIEDAPPGLATSPDR